MNLARNNRIHQVPALAAVAWLLVTSVVSAQTDEQITPELIDARRNAAAASDSLSDEQKKTADAHYKAAGEGVTQIEELRSTAARLRQDAETVQDRVQLLRDRFDSLQGVAPAGPEGADLPALEQERAQRSVTLTELKAALARIEAEAATRAGRRSEIRGLLLSAAQRMADVNKLLTTPAPPDEPTLLTQARVMELRVRLQVIEAEGPALQNELALYDAEEAANFVRWERDVRTQEVALAEAELKLFDERIDELRAEANAAALQRARLEAIDAEPLLQTDADVNRALAEKAVGLNAPIEKAKSILEDTKSQLEALQKQFTATQQKVESIGLTGAVGALLRRQKSELPDLARRQAGVRERRAMVEQAQYDLFSYDDQRRELANRDELVDQILARAPADMPPEKRASLEQAARDVFEHRAEFLDQLIRSYTTWLDTLFELDTTEQLLIAESARYTDYIDERVLWIRSNDVLFSRLEVDDTDKWLLSPARWMELGGSLGRDVVASPAIYLLVMLTAAVLLALRPLCCRHLAAAGELAARGTCTSYAPTLRAAWLTVLLAVVWPGVVWFLAMRLPLAAYGSPFVLAVGQGLKAVAWGYLPLSLLLQICRPNGLADHHFDWPVSTIHLFRRTVPGLLLCGLPLAFVTATVYASESQSTVESAQRLDFVERASFVATTVVLALFLRRVMRPDTGVLREYLATHAEGWLCRLRFFWYWGTVLSPLCLAGLAVAGYYFTARQLAWRLFATIAFVLSVQLVRAFLTRLVIVQRRKLSIDQARKRREEQATRDAATSGDAAESGTAPAAVVPLDELHDDVQQNTEQSRRLLSLALIVTSLVGVWMIWIDVLPALRFLDQWPLWTTRVEVPADEVSPDTPRVGIVDDGVSHGMVEVTRPVTPRDVALAILLALVTFACARNIPGLMEMWILQQLPLDQSVRYAITTLTRYVIILLGIVVSFHAIYVGWSKVQWLATALTFGLGFGLQEIFANFVAGLILLFERPIRIGDVVTVDDISGVVSRIRIRATTITNWDRKEYVIPNKEFITGRMLNWTLTDKVNRVVINVGIAYGSDVARAKEILLDVCREHPLTLSDPGASVTFSEFGDSTLNLVVRTYLPDLDNRLGVIDALHTQIDLAFREADIEIAFPQHDLHLRSIDDPAAGALRRTTSPDVDAA